MTLAHNAQQLPDTLQRTPRKSSFQRALRLPPERTHLVTWQALLARAKSTFDPGVRPLLAHAAQLAALQPPDQVG